MSNLNKYTTNAVTLDIGRSTMDLSTNPKTTFTSGKLIPFYMEEVIPGDTFNIDTTSVIRMLTPVVPVMDNAYLDIFYFFVPHRLSCSALTGDPKRWEKVCGENTSGPWAPVAETFVPTEDFSGTIGIGSFGNYLGMAQIDYSDAITINTMPLGAYQLIWNEFFRDQNLQSPITISSSTFDYDTDCLDVCKLHDYFTSALPSPQKGASVQLSLGSTAPVITGAPGVNLAYINSLAQTWGVSAAIRAASAGGTAADFTKLSSGAGTTFHVFNLAMSSIPADKTSVEYTQNVKYPTTPSVSATNSTVYPGALTFDNLLADLSGATASTINELRQSFAIQRMLEKEARGGSRYKEILKAHFNVDYPDLTLNRPEYLGGKRTPVNITSVLQNSSTDETSPLGFTGAYSHTIQRDAGFTKSFGEYGLVFGLLCVRPVQSYSQGLPRFFKKSRRYDFYWPGFANLGEQPVYNYEIFVDGDEANDLGIFGYQERYAEYRYKPSIVSGALAPNSGDLTMLPWTFTSHFSARPVLGSTFIKQGPEQIGQTLSLTKPGMQFFADIYIKNIATRPMPVYAIPGLIDHH